MSGLVGRHIAFLEALRSAGLPVSLAEDLDAVAALQQILGGATASRGPRRVRRHAGQEAVAAAHLRRPLRPLLPGARGGRRR